MVGHAIKDGVVGFDVGANDESVGGIDGVSVGSIDGLFVGGPVTSITGEFDGALVGEGVVNIDDGMICFVGFAVGARVYIGIFDGVNNGYLLGEAVGI